MTWYDSPAALGLDDSFSSMFTLLTLHVWMVLAKVSDTDLTSI